MSGPTQHTPLRCPVPNAHVLRAGIVVATSLAVAHLAIRGWLAAGWPVLDSLTGRFDLDAEGSVGTWWSATQLLFTALACAAVARGAGPRGRRHWLILAAGIAYLSMDEVATLHEQLGDASHRLLDPDGVHAALRFAWVVPGAVAVCVAGVLLVPFVRALPSLLRRRLLVAALLFLSGALGLEVVGAVVSAQARGPAYVIVSTVEEWLEIVGVAAALQALLMHAAPAPTGVPRQRHNVEPRAGDAAAAPLSPPPVA